LLFGWSKGESNGNIYQIIGIDMRSPNVGVRILDDAGA
jgi:hypothetical protein